MPFLIIPNEAFGDMATLWVAAIDEAVDPQPDIKFLCGDQVYLDNPPQDFLNPLRSRKWLQARSFKTYADAWTQTTTMGGFARLLKHNANFFCSDDHLPAFLAIQTYRSHGSISWPPTT